MKKLLKKFLATRKFKERSRGKYNCTFHSLHQEESKTWRSINKEIRTVVWVSNFVQPNLHTCVFEFAVKLRVADVIDKKIIMQCLTCWKRLSKLLCDRETCSQVKKKCNQFFCVCFVFSTCKEYESFVPLDHKLQKRLAILLFFHLASDAFPDIGLVSWIEKKRN